MHRIKVAPSLLSSDFTKFTETSQFFESIGAEILHLDVMDGNFVPPITFGAAMVRDLKKLTSLMLDAHLMVSNPRIQVKQFIDAGADSITIHIESSDFSGDLLKQIKAANVLCAIAINPSTTVEAILDYIDSVDMVLLMSVNPGYGGQNFIPQVLDKVKELVNVREKLKLSFDIQIDGGINEDNIDSIIKAGANIIVTGSALMNSKDPKGFVQKIKGE